MSLPTVYEKFNYNYLEVNYMITRESYPRSHNFRFSTFTSRTMIGLHQLFVNPSLSLFVKFFLSCLYTGYFQISEN